MARDSGWEINQIVDAGLLMFSRLETQPLKAIVSTPRSAHEHSLVNYSFGEKLNTLGEIMAVQPQRLLIQPPRREHHRE